MRGREGGSGREGGESERKGGREWEEGREWEGGRRGGLPFTASVEGFPIETSTNGAQTLHHPTGQTLIRLSARPLLGLVWEESPFIVSDVTDLDSAVEGVGDVIPLTNARY